MDIQTNYPLADLTTFKIGGLAKYFCQISHAGELQQALAFAKEKALPILVLGNGSNLVVSDEGFPGLVIHNKILGLQVEDSGYVAIGAGENWDDVVAASVEKNLAGIECLSGIPGSAGGALVQNIGAYGQTISDSIMVETIVVDTATGQQSIFSKDACEFAYRNSFFKANPNKYILIEIRLLLEPNGKPNISYTHVFKHFQNKPIPTLSELRQFILQLRASKGYLIMPGYERYNTAGSYFKNPIVSLEKYIELKLILGDISLNRFWETPNGVKIAAAFLLEQAGFAKGYREGNVGISPKHSLSIINFGGAKASEVKALAEKIKQAVLSKFGITLEEEILYV